MQAQEKISLVLASDIRTQREVDEAVTGARQDDVESSPRQLRAKLLRQGQSIFLFQVGTHLISGVLAAMSWIQANRLYALSSRQFRGKENGLEGLLAIRPRNEQHTPASHDRMR